MTHEQIIEKAWRLISDLGITEEREKYESDPDNHYLVGNIHAIRDAFYSDLEGGIEPDESVGDFLARHNILDVEVFEEMIRDWQADNEPDHADLEIGEIEYNAELKTWTAIAEDKTTTYLLTAKDGNIVLNYSGSK